MTNSPAYKNEAQSAKLTKTDTTGKIASNRKEKNFYRQYSLIAVEKGERTQVRELVVARLYATNAKHYCCVWINHSPSNTHVSGGGSASGYGYHKASAAFEAACDNAGIAFAFAVGGVGDSAIESAMKAIGVALGYDYDQLTNIIAHS